MSEQSSNEPDVGGIRDEDLPEDLRPTDDNPLAKDPGDEDEEDQGLHPDSPLDDAAPGGPTP